MPFLSRTVNRPPVSSAAALAAVDISNYNSHVTCVVVDLNTLYEYNKTSTATADNSRVIQPTTGVGRWIRIASEILGAGQSEFVWKGKVTVATTANITLSGEQTIDGILTSESRVLVKEQTDATENGIYLSDAGAWARSEDGTTGSSLVNSTVPVVEGTTFEGIVFKNTNTSITLGVTLITYVIFETETLAAVLAVGNSTGANDIVVDNGQSVQTNTTAADTFELKAFDVDGAAYTTFATLTANNTPTMDLETSVTRGGNTILDDTSTISALTTVGTIDTGVWEGTDVGVTFGGTGISSVPANGALIIGNGTGYASATLTATADQTTITNGAGTVTVGTVQDIGTTSTPTFNLATLNNSPSVASDATRKDYVDGLFQGFSWKDNVQVATTGDITLSGEQTIDGVLTSTSRVLVRAQSDATENGMYLSAAGAWARTADANTGAEIVNSTVPVIEGSTFDNKTFKNTNDAITIGVTSITYTLLAATQDHNALSGLQGGTTNEFFHATSAEITVLQNTSGTNTGDQNLSQVLADGNTTGSTDIVISDTQAIQTATTAADTFELKAFDVDGATYTTFITFTANNTPTCDLSTAVTVGGSPIVVDSDIGVTVQAFDAGLTDIAGLGTTDSNFIVGNGANWVAETGNTARTSLGLGTGDSPTFTDVTTTAALTSGTTITGGTQALDDTGTPYSALDVSGTTTLLVDTTGGVITINDLSGGVLGQIVFIVRIGAVTNVLTITNSSGANQQIRLQGAGDYGPLGKSGGIGIVFDGTDWVSFGKDI